MTESLFVIYNDKKDKFQVKNNKVLSFKVGVWYFSFILW